MTVLRGDCVEVMAGMEPDSVDAIVTDPPYGLEFMGKEWDRLGETGWGIGGFGERDGSTWPSFGATAAANASCRTCGGRQRGARKCSCDQPDWHVKGVAPERAATDLRAANGKRMERWHAQWAAAALRVAKPGAYLLAFGGTRTVHRMTCALEDAGWVIRDMLVWAYAQGFPKSKASLKPAWEPIVLARKPGPLRDLNIDACRLSAEGYVTFTERIRQDDERRKEYRKGTVRGQVPTTEGRWPSNVLLSPDAPIFDGGWDGVVGGGASSPGTAAGKKGSSGFASGYDGEYHVPYGDEGTYSRYFLIPKAPSRERVLSDGRRSPHPTQKPEALIRHLVRLVTPDGGLVLDPFLGSGTLGVVCDGLGIRWAGIEREPEYADWAEDRIADQQPAWSAA